MDLLALIDSTVLEFNLSNIRSATLSGSRLLLLAEQTLKCKSCNIFHFELNYMILTIEPTENTLSDDAEEAGMERISLATLDNNGNMSLFCFQNIKMFAN